MPNAPEFDIVAAHRYFSAQCFNRAWDLIEKTDRTPENDQRERRMTQMTSPWSQPTACGGG